jgi:hypothetical protein
VKPYLVSEARYAKNQMLVRCPGDGSGFKDRAARLCCHLRGRWTNREHGYVMSRTKVAKLNRLFDDGWDATIAFSSIPSKLEPAGAAANTIAWRKGTRVRYLRGWLIEQGRVPRNAVGTCDLIDRSPHAYFDCRALVKFPCLPKDSVGKLWLDKGDVVEVLP